MKTKDIKTELIQRINKRIAELKLKLLTLVILFGVGFASCNKYENYVIPDITPQEQLILQTFDITTIVKEQPLTKSWNPETWIYNYSDTKFELKLTNQTNTYSKIVSINELRTGTVSINMVVGKYDITYTPIHSPLFSSVLDVSINMSDVEINGTPVILQGTLDDALIILDLPNITDIQHNGSAVFYQHPDGYWYAYTNKPINELNLTINNGETYKTVSVTLLQTGKVYWFVSNLGATFQLNIPAMEIIKIGI